jgi:hypothetical protein
MARLIYRQSFFRSAKTWSRAASLLAALCAAPAMAAETGSALNPVKNAAAELTITSTSFKNNEEIPIRHTCEGADVSPEVSWTGVPSRAKSLALIVDDPDAPDPAAPKKTVTHWLLYNMPTKTTTLPEGVSTDELPAGTLQGINEGQRTGYSGPCPPVGQHRYFFKLYALDAKLPDMKQPTKAALEKAIKGHVIARAELIGLYQKQR